MRKGEERMKESKGKKLLEKYVITALVIIIFLLWMFLFWTFPVSLVMDLFQEELGAAELAGVEYNWGQLAGLPAGEGVPLLEDIEQFQDIAYELDYITFETDSIIPLDFYSLKDTAEQNYTSRTRRRTIQIHRSVYTTNPFLGMEKVYNRYYLVKLPDENYVLSYLDDAYYVKYKLAGKVQLPLGRVVQMTANEREFVEDSLAAYELDEELILDMFAEERYEQQDFLNTLVPFGVATVTAGLLLAILIMVEKIFSGKSQG